jgi:hypothetical protein
LPRLSKQVRIKTEKAAFPEGNRSFSVYETSADHTCDALRDGASCPERLW